MLTAAVSMTAERRRALETHDNIHTRRRSSWCLGRGQMAFFTPHSSSRGSGVKRRLTGRTCSTIKHQYSLPGSARTRNDRSLVAVLHGAVSRMTTAVLLRGGMDGEATVSSRTELAHFSCLYLRGLPLGQHTGPWWCRAPESPSLSVLC